MSCIDLSQAELQLLREVIDSRIAAIETGTALRAEAMRRAGNAHFCNILTDHQKETVDQLKQIENKLFKHLHSSLMEGANVS